MAITQHSVVTFHYTLTGEGGETLESTRERLAKMVRILPVSFGDRLGLEEQVNPSLAGLHQQVRPVVDGNDGRDESFNHQVVSLRGIFLPSSRPGCPC